MELSHEGPIRGQGLLYPMMVIAAIAVIAFSIVGIATITGSMPAALSSPAAQSEPRALGEAAGSADPDVGRGAFECAECGVIESIREIERGGSLASARVHALAPTSLQPRL